MFRRLKAGETLRKSDEILVGTVWIPIRASTNNPQDYIAAKKGPKYRRWVNKKPGYFSWLLKRIKRIKNFKNFKREVLLCITI